jgi:hypothetical protein
MKKAIAMIMLFTIMMGCGKTAEMANLPKQQEVQQEAPKVEKSH